MLGANIEPRPFTVIAGFLGAGKTTLVNRILTEAQGTRFAVLVNDFGAINVDAGLIEAHDGQTLALTNGCICCSMADGFVQTMLQLMADPEAFDHVIVEASGVAEPSKIMDFARLDPLLQPDATVTLADAETLAERLQDRHVGSMVAAQVRQGDLLILNKVDLADPASAEAALRQLNEDAPLLAASNAEVPLEAVLGTGMWKDAGEVPATAHARFHTVTLRREGPSAQAEFESWERALPTSILRGKGLIQLENRGPMTWQRVGIRSELSPSRRDGNISEIVLIGIEPIAAEDFQLP